MALNASSSLQNVKTSIEKYIYDNIQVASSINVDYDGLPFESGSTGYTEWIQPRLFMFDDNVYWKPKTGTNKRGTIEKGLLNVNCFVKKGYSTSTKRRYVLRDTVYQKLFIDSGSSIPLRDYVGGTTIPYTTLIQVVGKETDRMIPDDTYYQWNITFLLQWVAEYGV